VILYFSFPLLGPVNLLGPKKDEARILRKLRNKELYSLYLIKLFETRKVIWKGHVVRMERR
jgi:hypothetical protein